DDRGGHVGRHVLRRTRSPRCDERRGRRARARRAPGASSRGSGAAPARVRRRIADPRDVRDRLGSRDRAGARDAPARRDAHRRCHSSRSAVAAPPLRGCEDRAPGRWRRTGRGAMSFSPLTHDVSEGAGGSPLYQMSADHIAGVIALLALPIAFWLVRRRGLPSLAPIQWLLVALLAGSAALHAGLALANGDHGAAIRALFAIDAVLLAVISRRVLRGSGVGRLGAAVLVGSIVAYWGSALSGESPDQIGLATKLGEILALAIVIQQAASRVSR